MRPRMTLSSFRKMTALEESMMRATMPKASANDAEPLAPHYAAPRSAVVGSSMGTRLARPSMAALTYKLAEAL